MFKKFDPRNGKRFQLLDEQGKLNPDANNFPMLSDAQLMHAYETMVLTREADDWAVSLNRQGRMPTYPPVKGQEANSVGSILAMNKDDWFVQAFREMGGLLLRDVPLSQQYLYFLGNEMGNHYEPEKYRILPVSVPIASQLPHAVGLAYAEQYKGTDRAVITYIGDGGTSQGDFHEALNFAGVWNAPVIFYVQNNQYAISVSRKRQTASATIAVKAYAYGFEGIQVDGNDLLAVYAATKFAVDRARKGGGPALIEGYTYRLGAHTTADDPTKYREDKEVEEWLKKDPLLRLEKYLLANKKITQAKIDKLKTTSKKQAQEAFEEAEKYPKESLDNTFRYTYKVTPSILEEQLERRRDLEGGNV